MTLEADFVEIFTPDAGIEPATSWLTARRSTDKQALPSKAVSERNAQSNPNFHYELRKLGINTHKVRPHADFRTPNCFYFSQIFYFSQLEKLAKENLPRQENSVIFCRWTSLHKFRVRLSIRPATAASLRCAAYPASPAGNTTKSVLQPLLSGGKSGARRGTLNCSMASLKHIGARPSGR